MQRFILEIRQDTSLFKMFEKELRKKHIPYRIIG